MPRQNVIVVAVAFVLRGAPDPAKKLIHEMAKKPGGACIVRHPRR